MMKRIAFSMAVMAACSGLAKTFDVDVSTGRPSAANEAFYHGETIEFRAVRGRAAVTNVSYGCIYYQTNGMGQTWWQTDGLVFAPSNDVGAASYRFFLEGRDDLGRDWHANGTLRLLDSPGFTPNVLELPVQRLDFAALDVSNAPYYTKPETEAKIAELAPTPGNYAAVSNAAMTALQSSATNDLATTLRSEIASAQPGNYAAVSNAAMTALQSSDIPTIEGYALGNLGDNINITNYDGYIDIIPSLLRSGNFVGSGSAQAPSTTTFYGWSLGISEGFWDELWDDIIEYAQISNGTVVIGNNTITPLTSHQSLDDYATKTAVAAAAAASTNYTDSALSNYYTASEVDSAVASATPADYDELKSTVSDLETESALIYRLYSGSNVVCEVTNYNSVVHAPEMRLLQLTESNTYITVWAETNGLSRIARAATNYTDSAITAATNRFAPRAWSAVTSGLGVDAPSETTWISTPTTVIAGGFEYQKVATSSGAMWVLASNGMTSLGDTSTGYLDIAAADGTSIFRIEKTDSYLVGADPDGISVSGDTATISLSVVAASHPYLRYTPSLAAPVTWYKEEESTIPGTVSYQWSGSSGAWVCTVTSSASSGFFFFEFLQEGSVKIINNAQTDLSQGIYYNGVKYMPSVSGTELKFLAE